MRIFVRPNAVEVPRVLKPCDGRHVDLVDSRHVVSRVAREHRGDVDGLEEGLHMRDRLRGRMIRHGLGVWMETVREPVDLTGVEDPVGFLETEDAGVVGLAIVGRVTPLPLFPALPVIDHQGGFLAFADPGVHGVGLWHRHPEGRAVARHRRPHGQQEVVDALVRLAAHAQGPRAATRRPGLAPRQDSAFDDPDEFVRDRRGGVELGLGFGHGWSPMSEGAHGNRARIGERLWKAVSRRGSRIPPEPRLTPFPPSPDPTGPKALFHFFGASGQSPKVAPANKEDQRSRTPRWRVTRRPYQLNRADPCRLKKTLPFSLAVPLLDCMSPYAGSSLKRSDAGQSPNSPQLRQRPVWASFATASHITSGGKLPLAAVATDIAADCRSGHSVAAVLGLVG